MISLLVSTVISKWSLLFSDLITSTLMSIFNICLNIYCLLDSDSIIRETYKEKSVIEECLMEYESIVDYD